MKTSAEKFILSTYSLQQELPEFPVYQEHFTEDTIENCTKNLRNWNTDSKNIVTFKALMLYMSSKDVF